MSASKADLAFGSMLSVEQILALLSAGTIHLEGLVPWSSNYTFVATVQQGDKRALAIYKPSRGERPLWDFGEGSLCQREVAAFHLSQALGWPRVPPVVVADGPHGPGSLQLCITADLEEHYFTLRDDPRFAPSFQRLALFDYVANNADRKAGHVLRDDRNQIWAIDHGLTFHAEYKLRTVIWDYAGQAIPTALSDDLERAAALLDEDGSMLRTQLARLLSDEELDALARRFRLLLRVGHFPMPAHDWRNVPYPLV